MYLLRRAAVRSFSSHSSSAFLSKPRTLVTKTPSTLRAQQWQVSSFQRRFASDEPTKTDEIKEKAEDAAEQTKSTVLETAQNATESIKDAAASTAEAVQETTRSAAAALLGKNIGEGEAGTFGQPKPSKILYVGNLFFEVKADELEREFSRFGDVTNCRIAQDPRGLSKGFGYVEFAEAADAAKAMEVLDQQTFQGRRMAVQYHVRRDNRAPISASTFDRRERTINPPSKTLFIGNMSFQMSDKDLNDVFKETRNVVDVRVAIDRRSGQPRGFAHADFLDVESATEAKKMLENKTIFGRQLRVDFSKDVVREPREHREPRERYE